MFPCQESYTKFTLRNKVRLRPLPHALARHRSHAYIRGHSCRQTNPSSTPPSPATSQWYCWPSEKLRSHVKISLPPQKKKKKKKTKGFIVGCEHNVHCVNLKYDANWKHFKLFIGAARGMILFYYRVVSFPFVFLIWCLWGIWTTAVFVITRFSI